MHVSFRVIVGAGVGGLLACVSCLGPGKPIVAAEKAGTAYAATALPTTNGLLTYEIVCAYQETPCRIEVLLPDTFDRARKYKVLYVLPVDKIRPNQREGGMDLAKKMNLANRHHVICAAPLFSGMPWIADNPTNTGVWNETYMTDVIVPFMDRTFPTMTGPEGRILVGYSKGGVASVSLLLRHPNLFGRAGAWDAPLCGCDTRAEYYGPQEYFMRNYYLPTMFTNSASLLQGQPARLAIAGYGWGSIPAAHKILSAQRIPHYCNDALRLPHEWNARWLGPLVEVLMAEDMAAKQAP